MPDNDLPETVMRFRDCNRALLEGLLDQFGLAIHTLPPGRPIPGSYWGAEEAGLQGNALLLRPDTPLHSVLHEACHYICMEEARRTGLDTDAGGGYAEENAVCYLQILLADELPGLGRERMMADMDAWGYTFRLGSAKAWFEEDAADARDWLLSHGLISPQCTPTYRVRKA